MSRANPVTKLGLIELARLTHEYLENHSGGVASSSFIQLKIARYRVYGHFRDHDLVNKIRRRFIVKRNARWRKPPGLIDRLRLWRLKHFQKVFSAVFPIVPSGGTRFSVKWGLLTQGYSFKSRSSRGGYYNHRNTQVDVNVWLHPHWRRRLGDVCLKMNRFFVDIAYLPMQDGSSRLWGLEVQKSRGYTFRCGWVMFTRKEIKENALDQLEPWQTDGLLGLDGNVAVRPVPVSRPVESVAGK